MAPQAERFETVIVGGGQAGLATGYHLAKPRPLLRDPGRKRADRGPLAPALGFAEAVLTREVRRAPGHALPRAASLLPHGARDGRLPRGVRGALRASRPIEHGCGRPKEGGGPLRRHGGGPDLRGGQRRRRVGRDAEAGRAELRAGARPADQAAPFERLPQPFAAAGGQRSRGRREPLGSRYRLRGGCRSRDHPVGTGHGSDPGIGRDEARARRLSRAVLRRLAHPHDGHAARPQDAAAHPARRRSAPALPKEGSARRRGRARPRADGRRRKTVCPCSTTVASSTSRT